METSIIDTGLCNKEIKSAKRMYKKNDNEIRIKVYILETSMIDTGLCNKEIKSTKRMLKRMTTK